MRIAVESYRGEAPRLTPRALPENGAQIARNTRLQSGDLESWRQFMLNKVLANDDTVRTIYLLNNAWLSWEADVDVARGAIAGDNTFRTYLTGPDLYDQPRFTNFALATTGPEPFPVVTRPLGVPSPDAQPTLAAGISTAPTSTTTEISDSGDELATSWSTSPPVNTAFTRSIVSQDAVVGNGPPSYALQADENTDAPAQLARDFGIGDSQVIEVSFDVLFNVAARKRMFAAIAVSSTGAGLTIAWTEAGSFHIGVMGSLDVRTFSSLAAVTPGGPAPNIWYTVTVQVVTNAQNARTVTATLFLGSVQIATVVATSSFTNRGGFVGFVNQIAEPTAPDPVTYYDNILVRGTSPASALTQTATSYVYTFVNDLGEESAPSPASATILKDDGTAITVTTATSVQSGFSVDYGVTTKRIYRAVTGNTGTVFRFVAEIPLSQAEYVDELTDSELGDELETDDWDLPPDDLRGILALPNGIMVGFRRNQICFSAQNHPHAWPVRFRLNTDTDVVAIGNIDTTVVVGTKAFPYLAIGNDPSAYSMTKLEVPQACVAKRSLAYLTAIGVVFASPDGLIAVAGNGRVSNLTESVFTRRQWQALLPDTIIGVAHDDVYHFWSGSIINQIDSQPVAFDPALTFGSDWTYTNSNRTATVGTTPVVGVPTASSSVAHSSGKWYVEFKWLGNSFAFTDVVRQEVGIGDPASTDNPSSKGVGYRFTGTMRREGSSSVQFTGPAIAQNDIIGFAIDLDTGKVWASINGVWVSGDPAAGTSPALTLAILSHTFAPCVSSESPVPNSWTLFGTEDALNFDVPAGFEAWGTTGSTSSSTAEDGFMLDMKPTGFGLVRAAYHVSAAHADPVTDQLYLVLDDVNEPAEPYLSLDSRAPTVSEPFVEIFEFDSPNAYSDMVYQWRGKLNRLTEEVAFIYCQVKADDYDNVVLKLYGDEVLLFAQVLTDKEPFTLPLSDAYETFEIELIGTSRIEAVRVAETIEELEVQG